jgi:hypothetical protein
MTTQLSARGGHSGSPRQRGKQLMLILAALAASTCLLTSCGGEARLVSPTVAVTPQQATPATSATPAQSTPVSASPVEPVVWATSVDTSTQAPSATVSSFTADASTIYACVSVNNLDVGAVIEGSWTYNGTSLDALATKLVLPDDVPRRWLAFHITRNADTLWPPGTYAIAIAVNGDVLQSASIEVTAAG